MKIKLSQFRKLIREVALSPSLKQNKPVEDPFQSKNVNVALEKLQAAFEQTLASDLIVRAMDQHYNEETREFDDAVYDKIKSIIKSIVDESRDEATIIVKKALQQAWNNAHHEESSSGAQSGTRIKAAKAA